jgi:hypothetical protein
VPLHFLEIDLVHFFSQNGETVLFAEALNFSVISAGNGQLTFDFRQSCPNYYLLALAPFFSGKQPLHFWKDLLCSYYFN